MALGEVSSGSAESLAKGFNLLVRRFCLRAFLDLDVASQDFFFMQMLWLFGAVREEGFFLRWFIMVVAILEDAMFLASSLLLFFLCRNAIGTLALERPLIKTVGERNHLFVAFAQETNLVDHACQILGRKGTTAEAEDVDFRILCNQV